MAAVEFGDGSEPWSVARGGVKRWLHCRVDAGSLADERHSELDAWLADQGIHEPTATLLVTRGDDGYQVHLSGHTLPVGLVDLPGWLQRCEPEPQESAAQRPARRNPGRG